MNYLFEPEFLTSKTNEAIKSLAKNKPDADFVEFAASVVYDRLKSNIQRYRVYGPYWWAVKDILTLQGYDMGLETDSDIAGKYKGANDAETLVAADTFYLDMSNKVAVDNKQWALDNRRPDYVLHDSDMENRSSITESSLEY